jgi:anti-anti-sigma factor
MAATKQPFEATIRWESGVIIIDLSGEINAFAEEGINEVFTEAAADNPERIMLNFGDVTYINSTGIALIVGLLAEARKNHIQLVTYGLSEHYIEIFHITRLADFMSIVPDESSALAVSP